MVEPWLQRIFDRIAQRNLSRAEVLRRAGLANSTFNDWMNGSKPSYENLDKVLEVIGWTRDDLNGDTTRPRIRLDAAYEILGKEMWAPARGKPKEVPLTILNEDLISLEVTTTEYSARGYRLGDIVSGPRQGRNFHNLIGSDCIAESKDGMRYFKILGKRDSRGRYTLKSFDPAGDDINGIELKWIAPIKLILRP